MLSFFLFWRHDPLLCKQIIKTRSFSRPCSWDKMSWPLREEMRCRVSRLRGSGKANKSQSQTLWSTALPAALLTSTDRMQVNCSPFTSASTVGFTRLAFFIRRGRERGRKPGEETSPWPRRQATSRAKFCHKVTSATGRDGSKYIFPRGSLASVSTLPSPSEHHRELHAHTDPEQINSNVQHATDWVNSILVYTEPAEDDILKLQKFVFSNLVPTFFFFFYNFKQYEWIINHVQLSWQNILYFHLFQYKDLLLFISL